MRCQTLAWPLFHKQAKVGVPLRGSRLAEGSIRSAWIRRKQRYRFDVASLFSRAALPRRHREPDMRVLWCDAGQKEAEQAWSHGRMLVSSVHQVTLLLVDALNWLQVAMCRNAV